MHLTILLLLSHFLFWPSPLDWQMSQGNVAIRGAVVDETTGGPIGGATVYAISDADVQHTTADARGHFIFLTLLPGTYRLCASQAGYSVDCYPRDAHPEELYAGFEYGATVVLSHALQ